MYVACTIYIQLQQCKGEVLGAVGIGCTKGGGLVSIIISLRGPVHCIHNLTLNQNQCIAKNRQHLKRPPCRVSGYVCSCDRRGSQHFLITNPNQVEH